MLIKSGGNPLPMVGRLAPPVSPRIGCGVRSNGRRSGSATPLGDGRVPRRTPGQLGIRSRAPAPKDTAQGPRNLTRGAAATPPELQVSSIPFRYRVATASQPQAAGRCALSLRVRRGRVRSAVCQCPHTRR